MLKKIVVTLCNPSEGLRPSHSNNLLFLVIIPYAYFTTPVAILMLKGMGVTLCNPSGKGECR